MAYNDCIKDCGCNDNPCKPIDYYDNCGCLNPTTFDCISKPGVHTNLGITDNMTAKEVLALLNTRSANPYQKVTQTQRIDMVSPTVGTHVYQTDGGSAEGVYVYKSTGWIKAY